MPAQVAQASKREQQAAQHEQVDGHHPLDRRHVAVEGVAQDRQDRVDNAAVQCCHERAGADGDEHQPFSVNFFSF
jgi:hypothetical protein